VIRIDPPRRELTYATYLGGRYEDWAFAIATDGVGAAYVTGTTQSLNFPLAGALQDEHGGGICGEVPCADVFVTKIDAFGSLVYSTFLGGSKSEYGNGIAVDAFGNAYVVGNTHSPDFPTTRPLQAARAGANDGFLTILNASGTALVFSTYLGGSRQDYISAVALDPTGNIYVTGLTDSDDFPTVRPRQRSVTSGRCGFSRCADAFVTKFDSNGSAMLYSSYLGGSNAEGGFAVVVAGLGAVHVAGNSRSLDYPQANILQPAHGGARYNFWLARIVAP
jgi:hypothetical protein